MIIDFLVVLFGVCLGIAIRQAILEREHPYVWRCPWEGCSFSASTNSGDLITRIRLGHEERHWSD